MASFEIRHCVGFEETSLVGNVYFTNYLLWQGHCREFFLQKHAPSVLDELARGELAFLTRSCSCDYLGDRGFEALDEVVIQMTLDEYRGGRMVLDFVYYHAGRPDEIIARGRQEIHCKVKRGATWVPAPFPPDMIRALLSFSSGSELRAALQQALDFQGGRNADSA